ncbi:MAG: XdhC family protein [Acidimicrobiales bacterium]|nr:XdhC family protein [Acidimicrobiales bacterium]
MYGIALSVSACLRGGTRVDVAWNLDIDKTPNFDPTDAVGITPGGGRLGSLLGGAIDSRLVELSLLEATEGRIVDVELNEIEAGQIGVDPGTTLRIYYAPASTLPSELWDRLLQRQPVAIDVDVTDNRAAAASLGEAPTSTKIEITGDRVLTQWSPTTTLVLYGGGPMADALGRAASFLGWKVEATGSTETAIALATSLSSIDGIVVMGHDTESVGRILQAALGSEVNYIGSIGPASLQQDRGDWLAYRGITDTTRIHGPAGLAIGAKSPEEVALSVLAEMIAVRSD